MAGTEPFNRLIINGDSLTVLYLNPSGQFGGAERSLCALIGGLREQHPDWRLYLLLGEDGPLADCARGLGAYVEIAPLPRKLAAVRRGGKLASLALLIATLHYRKRLKAAIRKLRPDVIHSNGFKMHILTASLSQRASCRAVRICHVHDYLRDSLWTRRLARFASGRFNFVVANSKSVAAQLLAIGVPAFKLTSIHNGIQMERFSPSGTMANLDQLSEIPDTPPDAVRVGLVAAFAKWKGQLTFLRALALLPADTNIRGYLIGGPIYRAAGSQYTLPELRRAAEKLCPGVKIGFTGVVDDVAAAYRALDVVVQASTDPEPFGMVLIEAMSCRRAVIASRGGGAVEIFEEDISALAHDPGDAAALARQMLRLAADPMLRWSLGENGRASVSLRFQASAMATSFAELYAKLTVARYAHACTDAGGANRCFA